jgi:hypothetical protein
VKKNINVNYSNKIREGGGGGVNLILFAVNKWLVALKTKKAG